MRRRAAVWGEAARCADARYVRADGGEVCGDRADAATVFAKKVEGTGLPSWRGPGKTPELKPVKIMVDAFAIESVGGGYGAVLDAGFRGR